MLLTLQEKNKIEHFHVWFSDVNLILELGCSNVSSDERFFRVIFLQAVNDRLLRYEYLLHNRHSNVTQWINLLIKRFS